MVLIDSYSEANYNAGYSLEAVHLSTDSKAAAVFHRLSSSSSIMGFTQQLRTKAEVITEAAQINMEALKNDSL